MSKRAVFFDRDDTLIRNIPYNGDPQKVTLMPFAVEALKLLKEKGYLIFVASNQSGVGRGLITKEQVQSVYEEMNRQLGQEFFTAIYNCYAAPGQEGGELRKPSPHMLEQARDEHGVDLAKSFMIGDRHSDIMSGKNAGCRSIWVPTDDYAHEHPHSREHADFVAENLLQAVNWILEQP